MPQSWERLSDKLRLLHYDRQDTPRTTYHEHWCPGCKDTHIIAVNQPFKNGAQWSYNGNPEAPTFNPSINISPNMPRFQCHYFIRDGKIEFCGDCHHELKGQTVDLPTIPDGEQPGKTIRRCKQGVESWLLATLGGKYAATRNCHCHSHLYL